MRKIVLVPYFSNVKMNFEIQKLFFKAKQRVKELQLKGNKLDK